MGQPLNERSGRGLWQAAAADPLLSGAITLADAHVLTFTQGSTLPAEAGPSRVNAYAASQGQGRLTMFGRCGHVDAGCVKEQMKGCGTIGGTPL